jgi:ABC-type nitrate/sulfonate/bicarbonate transport system permease component
MKNIIKKIKDNITPYIFIIIILACWSAVSYYKIVPNYLLPSIPDIITAFAKDINLLFDHTLHSLMESFIGLFISIAFAFIIASLMDIFEFLNKAVYPILILTQTVPVIAIAPLLVLWFGYGMLPKIVLIFLVCFFPLAIGLMQGFASVDPDLVDLFASMGANKWRILFDVKIPSSMPEFFAGLKISASYSIVGAVVAEWLGGDYGLGVYMTRVRKSYSFDKMFAVIILVSIISLILIKLVEVLEKRTLKWRYIK